MLFLRVGWMKSYRGLTAGDPISGGGAFVAEHGYGHEIFNFEPDRGYVYGYVQPVRGLVNQADGSGIHIERLGASKKDQSISDVLVVWVAKAPEGGCFVVGWYAHATIYRQWQNAVPGANRNYRGEDFGYYVTAAATEAVLLPPDKRLLLIPQGAGGMGQSNVWFAGDTARHKEIRLAVLRFIATRAVPNSERARKGKSPHQPDTFLKQEVERVAYEIVADHYAKLGYDIHDVQEDNLGWDLTAAYGRRQLKIEVKGLSGGEVCIELTPNEYANMLQYRDSYRVCVVTNALSLPQLAIFAYSQDSQRWEDDDGRELKIDKIIAARCRAG